MSGPLQGIKVVELAGIGPGPMCAMLLSDLGAEVIRVDRLAPADLGIDSGRRFNVLNRGRRSIAVDLKSPEGVEVVLKLVEQADAFIEGFRPGVTERLGLGPDVCLARNPRLVYGRMTGWGQEGPMAHAAGHDINYIALTGALDAIGTAGGPPVPPLNLVGDFGGGALYLAFGVCAALLEARTSGQGQVIDAAMVDGAASLLTAIYGIHASGGWNLERGTNLLDTGAHFYGTYECADGKWISIGSIEAKFHAELLEKLGLSPSDIPNRMDKARWVEHKKRLTELFLSQAPATSGAPPWKAAMSASLRCCRWPRPRSIRTCGSGARSWRSRALSSPDPHRASAAPRARSRAHRPHRANTPRPSWPTGVGRPTPSPLFAPPEP